MSLRLSFSPGTESFLFPSLWAPLLPRPSPYQSPGLQAELIYLQQHFWDSQQVTKDSFSQFSPKSVRLISISITKRLPFGSVSDYTSHRQIKHRKVLHHVIAVWLWLNWNKVFRVKTVPAEVVLSPSPFFFSYPGRHRIVDSWP